MDSQTSVRVIETLLDQIDDLKKGSSAKPVLSYFNGRGLGEISRMMLAVAGVDFEDKRYKFTIKDGEGSIFTRISKPEMEAASAAGELDANLGRLPILAVGGTKIGGSKAIERYIASEYGLAGSGALQSAEMDSICEHIDDISSAFDKAEDKDAFFACEATAQGKRCLPFYLQALNKIVGSDGYAVGSKFSRADVKFFSKFADTCMTLGIFGPPKSEPLGSSEKTAAALAKYAPNIAKIVGNLGESEVMKNYIAKRGDQDF